MAEIAAGPAQRRCHRGIVEIELGFAGGVIEWGTSYRFGGGSVCGHGEWRSIGGFGSQSYRPERGEEDDCAGDDEGAGDMNVKCNCGDNGADDAGYAAEALV